MKNDKDEDEVGKWDAFNAAIFKYKLWLKSIMDRLLESCSSTTPV